MSDRRINEIEKRLAALEQQVQELPEWEDLDEFNEETSEYAARIDHHTKTLYILVAAIIIQGIAIIIASIR